MTSAVKARVAVKGEVEMAAVTALAVGAGARWRLQQH